MSIMWSHIVRLCGRLVAPESSPVIRAHANSRLSFLQSTCFFSCIFRIISDWKTCSTIFTDWSATGPTRTPTQKRWPRMWCAATRQESPSASSGLRSSRRRPRSRWWAGSTTCTAPQVWWLALAPGFCARCTVIGTWMRIWCPSTSAWMPWLPPPGTSTITTRSCSVPGRSSSIRPATATRITTTTTSSQRPRLCQTIQPLPQPQRTGTGGAPS